MWCFLTESSVSPSSLPSCFLSGVITVPRVAHPWPIMREVLKAWYPSKRVNVTTFPCYSAPKHLLYFIIQWYRRVPHHMCGFAQGNQLKSVVTHGQRPMTWCERGNSALVCHSDLHCLHYKLPRWLIALEICIMCIIQQYNFYELLLAQ